MLATAGSKRFFTQKANWNQAFREERYLKRNYLQRWIPARQPPDHSFVEPDPSFGTRKKRRECWWQQNQSRLWSGEADCKRKPIKTKFIGTHPQGEISKNIFCKLFLANWTSSSEQENTQTNWQQKEKVNSGTKSKQPTRIGSKEQRSKEEWTLRRLYYQHFWFGSILKRIDNHWFHG